MKLYIRESGDESVGIMPSLFEVECPFNKDEQDHENLEWFKSEILKIYAEFSEVKMTAEYDFEAQKIDESYEKGGILDKKLFWKLLSEKTPKGADIRFNAHDEPYLLIASNNIKAREWADYMKQKYPNLTSLTYPSI